MDNRGEDWWSWVPRLCLDLEHNHPGVTELHLANCFRPGLDDERARQIGRALRGNTVVTHLAIRLDSLSLAGIRPILRFLATSPSLKEVEFLGVVRSSHLMNAVYHQCLTAIAFNGRIQKLRTRNFGMEAHALANCLRALPLSQFDFGFSSHDIEAEEVDGEEDDTGFNTVTTENAEIIAEAIGSSDSLEVLFLDVDQQGGVYIPLLNRLVQVGPPARLHALVVDSETGLEDGVAQPIANLLVSCTSLRTFHFMSMFETLEEMRDFETILNHMHQHPSIRDASFNLSSYLSDNAVPHFVELFRNNHVLETVYFCISDLSGICDILDTLASQASPLKSLEIGNVDTFEYLENREGWRQSHQRLREILPRLEKLESLSLVSAESLSPDMGQLIIAVLPDLMHLFDCNRSLTKFSLDYIDEPPADIDPAHKRAIRDAREQFDYYETRNQFGPAIEDSTSTVEMLRVFKDVLESSNDQPQRGLTFIFEILRAREGWYDIGDSTAGGKEAVGSRSSDAVHGGAKRHASLTHGRVGDESNKKHRLDGK